jgi:hypothetical protein
MGSDVNVGGYEMYRAGEKIRLKESGAGHRSWFCDKGTFTLPVGKILEVYEDQVDIESVRVISPFPDILRTLLIESGIIEYVPPCTCPPQNFYFNGVGCQCGGS